MILTLYYERDVKPGNTPALHRIQPSITDNRNNMELYNWQKECLKAWESNNYRGIVNVVTGAGKTVLALAAVEAYLQIYPDAIIRIVVPTIPLAHQWKQSLMHQVPSDELRPGFFGGGVHDDPSQKVMIYVINSARDHLSVHIRRELALNHHVLLICDECHHYQSKHNRRIFSFLTREIKAGSLYGCLGLSATPFGTDSDKILTESLGREIYRYNAENAVSDGIVSPFIVGEVSASFYPAELEEYLELSDKIALVLRKMLACYPRLKGLNTHDFIRNVNKLAKKADMDPEEPAAAFLILTYERKKICNLASSRIACAMALLEQLKASDKILIFCEQIEQACELMVAIHRKYGTGSCGIYHSGMTTSARKRTLSEFREGRFRILVSCKCLDEGLDVPDANIGIVLSSSAIERQRVQRLGRLLRKSIEKGAACLYYIYIRESSDDAAYLPGLGSSESFSLKYYTSENVFANDIYEYAAWNLLLSSEKKGFSESMLTEMRKCLSEGVARADYLMPESVQQARIRTAADTHERNYWKCMKRIGEEFRVNY